jgi:hypothetical protein
MFEAGFCSISCCLFPTRSSTAVGQIPLRFSCFLRSGSRRNCHQAKKRYGCLSVTSSIEPVSLRSSEKRSRKRESYKICSGFSPEERRSSDGHSGSSGAPLGWEGGCKLQPLSATLYPGSSTQLQGCELCSSSLERGEIRSDYCFLHLRLTALYPSLTITILLGPLHNRGNNETPGLP